VKTKRKVAGQNWEFDGSTITARIPMTWKRHGGRKVIIAPDGGDAWAPAKPRRDETLIRALARAHRLLRLTLLAPDIQEAILEGRQRRGMTVQDLTQVVPSAWTEQRYIIGTLHP
jgi:hypothetical protein